MKRRDDVVSGSEIASWSWCPVCWRLEARGNEPENRAALERGERHHAERAAFEQLSGSAISLGRRLVVAAVMAAALALVRGVFGHDSSDQKLAGLNLLASLS